MRSVRKGIRAGEIRKGLYDRLECVECERTLTSDDDAEVLGIVRACPECGREWEEIT
jgi:NAD-dependent SIR2 family protein deacetylase